MLSLRLKPRKGIMIEAVIKAGEDIFVGPDLLLGRYLKGNLPLPSVLDKICRDQSRTRNLHDEAPLLTDWTRSTLTGFWAMVSNISSTQPTEHRQ